MNRFLAWASGLVFLETRDVWPRLGDAVALVDVNKPAGGRAGGGVVCRARRRVPGLPERLAGQFNLDVGVIRRLGHAALEDGDSDTLAPRLWEGALANTRPHLETLAQRIDVVANWPLIVLPKAQEEQLRQICRPGALPPGRLRPVGLPRADEPRAGHRGAVRRRERHRQDDGRGGHRQRAAARPLPHRPRRGGEQVHRRDGEEPAQRSSTPPRTAAPSCSSTRPTRSSASAARSRTATTATPTSRSATCCSGWRPTAAWRSSRPT